MSRKKQIQVGQRRQWCSKAYKGSGIVVAVTPTAKGPYVALKTTAHPKGEISVRESQVW